MNTALSSAERERYRRHFQLPGFREEDQRRLKASSVLIVGVGGLGSPAALYLAAAGVGRIGLLDPDVVEASNLQRQVLFSTADLGAGKAETAAARLRALNPFVHVEAYPIRLTAHNVRSMVSGFDVVVDGTDSFASRYAINDACAALGIPDVSASIHQFEGQVSVYGTPDGPCYRCLFPETASSDSAPTCEEGGVLGVLPGLLGTIQATEVLKLLLRSGEPLIGRALVVDALTMRFRLIEMARAPACPACSRVSTPSLRPPTPAPGPSTMNGNQHPMEISASEVSTLMKTGKRPFLLDVREPHEHERVNIEGALIPLKELPDRVGELDAHREDPLVVVYCRTGARSARAVAFLREQGFRNAVNLRGGLHAWSDEVDPSVEKY